MVTFEEIADIVFRATCDKHFRCYLCHSETRSRGRQRGQEQWRGSVPLQRFLLLLTNNVCLFLQSTVRWDQKSCESEEIKAFPESAIPSYFSYNGTVRLGYRMCEQWIWRTGGHNAGQGTSLTAYYITYQTNAKEHYPKVGGAFDAPYVPVMVESFSNAGPTAKTSHHSVINITSYVNGEADEKLLELPSFCEKENLQV